jgi:toxin CcdB
MPVVDLQTDLIGHDARFPGLTPRVEIEDRAWIVRLQELAAVPAGALRTPVGSVAHARDALRRGLDVLIDGF